MMPCVYLDPFSSRSTSQLANMWDAVALTSAESDVVKALRVASPDIEAVSMIGGEASANRNRTAIVKSSKYSHPVPAPELRRRRQPLIWSHAVLELREKWRSPS